MSIVLIIFCILGAILIVSQSLLEAILTPYILIPIIIFVIMTILLSIRDLKKYGLRLREFASKKDNLYGIIDNIGVYHKIITNNEKIDLIVLLETGIITVNLLNIEGTIEVLENGDLFYYKKGGKQGKINNFLAEINEEVNKISGLINNKIDEKYLITNKNLIYKKHFAEGFNIKYIGQIFYELEKKKEKLYSKEDIDRMYEMINNGSNKN